MQRILNKKSVVWDYIMVIIGTGLLATSIKCLYDPMGLVTGGFTGLCIVIKEVTEGIVDGGIPLWLSNLILNIPLFLVALKVKGKRFIWRTIIGTFLLSAWIYVIPAVDLTQQDYFLAAVFGGCIGGAGMGLMSVFIVLYGWKFRFSWGVFLLCVVIFGVVLCGTDYISIREMHQELAEDLKANGD